MSEHKYTYEDVVDFENLYESSWLCRKTVSWKPSVKAFGLNCLERCLQMEASLKNGTWRHCRPNPIKIVYPKRREGLSVKFTDRIYQRTLNDLILYPAMVRSFIYDNGACQKGKGAGFARKRIKSHLWNHFSHYKTEGYVLQIDIKGYYQNMRHDVVADTFKGKLDGPSYRAVMDVLSNQYEGDVGYNPGSQMVQIAGISVLNGVDHYIKERLRIKHYIRYMDDMWILVPTYDEAERAYEKINARLAEIGFKAHPEKSHIRKLKSGFEFLGFAYRMTDTGKIIMTIKPEKVRHERRKLRRLANLAKKSKIDESKINECYQSWKAHAEAGNSKRMLRKMDAYYNSLIEEVRNAKTHKKADDTRG